MMLQITSAQIEQALNALKKGQVIVYPTETSYALGCDATNESAVRRIFEIKGRPGGKGLPVIIAEAGAASQYLDFSKTAKKLADLFWPGSLNIIGSVAYGSKISSACAEHGTQSVRASSHPFAATLASRFGKPLVATSANISGQDAIYTVVDVQKVFKGHAKPDLIIDAGQLATVPASTTVKVLGDEVSIIRQGSTIIPAEFLK